MQKIAGIPGVPSDAEEYARKKELARKLVHREFYDENKASYGNGNYILEREDAISE